jgi:hypothetical protein
LREPPRHRLAALILEAQAVVFVLRRLAVIGGVDLDDQRLSRHLSVCCTTGCLKTNAPARAKSGIEASVTGRPWLRPPSSVRPVATSTQRPFGR